MKHAAFLLAALVLAWTAFLAQAADQPKEKPVAVDPSDLRTPVPNPERELTQKYDGKVVVFSGNLQKSGQDTGTNKRWYLLGLQVPKEQSSRKAKPIMQTVTVKVYFDPREKRLPTRPALYVVEGNGEISFVDGALTIRNARMVSIDAKKSVSR